MVLLPEMQFEYAILDFKNLHISRKVKKLLEENNYRFVQNEQTYEVLNAIQHYHENSWMNDDYIQMLKEVQKLNCKTFQLTTFELYDIKTNQLIAGEVGYIIGKTYTSLSGFFQKNKQYNNWGKLQLILLSLYLEKNGFDFWNLGHACLQYKIDLGAQVYPRKDFLKRWLNSIQKV